MIYASRATLGLVHKKDDASFAEGDCRSIQNGNDQAPWHVLQRCRGITSALTWLHLQALRGAGAVDLALVEGVLVKQVCPVLAAHTSEALRTSATSSA
jgi:hypothetical protein